VPGDIHLDLMRASCSTRAWHQYADAAGLRPKPGGCTTFTLDAAFTAHEQQLVFDGADLSRAGANELSIRLTHRQRAVRTTPTRTPTGAGRQPQPMPPANFNLMVADITAHRTWGGAGCAR
jgi:hypothetical protein